MDGTKDIRNICFLGHGDSGKTTLAEAILFFTKNTDRQGKVTDGNTVSDYDEEEKKRVCSIQGSVLSFNWKNAKLNIIDAPGSFDFAGEAKQAARVADSTLIIVSAKSGIDVGTEIAAEYSDEVGIPKAIFVSRLDEENVNFESILNEAREKFGVAVCPVFVPYIENNKTAGYADVARGKYYTAEAAGGAMKEAPVPEAFESTLEEYKQLLFESMAETSEELMEKFFEEEPFTEEETENALRAGFAGGNIIPVFAGSAVSLAGIGYISDAIAKYFPNPLDKVNEKVYSAGDSGDIADKKIEENGNAEIFVFKSVSDRFGKMSYFKVMNGILKRDTVLKNLTSGQSEKIAHIYTLRGDKQTEVEQLNCGDIGMTSKLNATNTNDTLAAGGEVRYVKIKHPEPFLTKAIVPKSKGDADKISVNMAKLTDEDLTLRYENNAETHQMLLSGLGEVHIDIATEKLKKAGVAVEFSEPRVAYRETIKKKIRVEGKHKKQSGGSGQYGHVWIEFEPCDENPGLTFTESIFGGSVPKSFHPAVEKGLLECMNNGVLAGFPVVNLKANLSDGSYHDVDSNEISFRLAAHLAFKQLTTAAPVLLEPVGELKVIIPDAIVGDVMGDLNKRRGRVMGLNPSEVKKGYTVIDAEVPMNEMQTYTIQLRAMSQGRGNYEF
ncbi:MAG: elongation factor G, partial [Oscillospiraceae bacterium]|nr:elongation factor G [Oscillospiraceae bacterium]